MFLKKLINIEKSVYIICFFFLSFETEGDKN